MITLCHCKDKICLPEICVFVVLRPKRGEENKYCACSVCDILVYDFCFCAV